MQAKIIEAVKRAETGTGKARRLRRKGMLPGVLYGRKAGNVPVAVSLKEMENILAREGEGVLLQLRLREDGQVKDYAALLREVQRDPLRGTLLHADFHQISMEEKLRVTVPVVLVGEARGSKEGGILQHGIREVEVECLPADLPESIEVDVSDLGVGDHLEVGDLKVPAGVKILTEAEAVVATVVTAGAAEAEAGAEAGGEETPAAGE
ncbi:MAG: large subunit ribosomal protein [Clostridia bacterium]|nr:large subunit ribosomal protein [Clostridia bacterium]